MDDAIQTDLNLSSLSVSSPSVSSCSATLPFPVYYCKNSDLISVFARYVDPKWILFWLFWLAWRRQKKLKLLLFFASHHSWEIIELSTKSSGQLWAIEWMDQSYNLQLVQSIVMVAKKHHHHHWMDTLLLYRVAEQVFLQCQWQRKSRKILSLEIKT